MATELENGDQIEIITATNARPRPEWEGFVKTGRARSGIRRSVRAERMVEFSLIGKTILQKVFREYGKPFRSRSVEKIISVFNLQKLDDYMHILVRGVSNQSLFWKKYTRIWRAAVKFRGLRAGATNISRRMAHHC